MPVVLDTNVFVSAALFAQSKPSLAVRWAVSNDVILASVATLAELSSTMEQAKFDRYVSRAARREFIVFVHTAVKFVTVRRSIRACRDPKDDKFLEVVVNSEADALVTGDSDLLALTPFEGVPIVTPADYLAKVGG